jgi:hypothetical protein
MEAERCASAAPGSRSADGVERGRRASRSVSPAPSPHRTSTFPCLRRSNHQATDLLGRYDRLLLSGPASLAAAGLSVPAPGAGFAPAPWGGVTPPTIMDPLPLRRHGGPVHLPTWASPQVPAWLAEPLLRPPEGPCRSPGAWRARPESPLRRCGVGAAPASPGGAARSSAPLRHGFRHPVVTLWGA